MEKITKQQAAKASSRAWNHLYEAGLLREAAAFIQENHREGYRGAAQEQVCVLRSVAEDKADEAFDDMSLVDNYFVAELKPKAKKDEKELAAVKTA